MRTQIKKLAIAALLAACWPADRARGGDYPPGTQPGSPQPANQPQPMSSPAPGAPSSSPETLDQRRQALDRARQRAGAGSAAAPLGYPSGPAGLPAQAAQGASGATHSRIVVDRGVPATKGGKLSLDLRGLDIQEALKIFARETDLNIVAGANVHGQVSLFLKGVDLWQAFEAMLEGNDLAWARKGDVIQVIAASDYERLYGVSLGEPRRLENVRLKNLKPETARDLLAGIKTKDGEVLPSAEGVLLVDTADGIAAMQQALADLDVAASTRVFTLNYAKVEDILPQIPTSKSPAEAAISADVRTNRLLVTGSPARIEEVARIVSAFDAPHREVLIEAKIVQVQLDDNSQFGINWNYIFTVVNSGGDKFAGKVVGTLQIPPTGTLASGDAAAKGLTATIGSIPPNRLTATINLLNTVGRANILSSPRITALSGRAANILVGTKEAYVTQTVVTPGAGAATTTTEQVNFVDVGVKLTVTPMIGDDGFITMDIKPEVSSVNSTLTTARGDTIPIVRTSQAETSVMVKDGTTIVIGGLIEDTKQKVDNRVPILGRIPLLGMLFRSRGESIKKSELVIFLTPKLLTGAEAFKPEEPRSL